MDYRKIAQELSTTSTSSFLTNNFSNLAESIIRRFLDLTLETPEYRSKWLADPESKDPDLGLIERQKDMGYSDNKFFFHYRPDLVDLIRDKVDTRVHQNFLTQLQEMHGKLAIIAENIIMKMKRQWPNFNILKSFYTSEINKRHLLRLLSYIPGERTLAAKHDDKSFLTLHIADSTPGLLLGDSEEFVETGPRKMTAFLGIKAELISGYQFASMPHRVVATDSKPRWAMVFFTHVPVPFKDGDDLVQQIAVNRKKEYEKKLAKM